MSISTESLGIAMCQIWIQNKKNLNFRKMGYFKFFPDISVLVSDIVFILEVPGTAMSAKISTNPPEPHFNWDTLHIIILRLISDAITNRKSSDKLFFFRSRSMVT